MAIITLSNSLPTTSINTDAGISIVGSINSASLLPQLVHNQKILAGKRTLATNARVLNHGNLIVNNNRVSVADFSTHLNQHQPQTITSNSANPFGHASYTLKQPGTNEEFALSSLLLSTGAADRPDIVGSSTSPLVLEKLEGLSGSGSAFKSVVSPLSSPPSQTGNPINVQNFVTPLQLQLGYGQPILSTNQGQHRFIVSMPVTTAAATCTAQTGSSALTVGSAIGLAAFGNTGSSNLSKCLCRFDGV